MNPVKHVAIIMDGNGRWGINRKKSRKIGHKQGLKNIEKIIKFSLKKKIPYLTLYTFSTENWKRPKYEIVYLFNLLHNYLKKNIDDIHKQNIKIIFTGIKKKFAPTLKKAIKKSEIKTSKNNKLFVNIALNYGSKSEIIASVKKIIKEKKIINQTNIEKNLFTSEMPDPDILIRTGGQKRLSNFLLWQLAYSELFFLNKLWPDFNNNDFLIILRKFSKIKRNFGSI